MAQRKGGAIQTTTEWNARAIQVNLARNGIKSNMEKTLNGKWNINFVISISQMV